MHYCLTCSQRAVLHDALSRDEERRGREGGPRESSFISSAPPPSMHHCSAAVFIVRGNDLPRSGRKEGKKVERSSSKSNFPSYVLHLSSPSPPLPSHSSLSLLSLRGICAFPLSTCGMALFRLALEEKQTSPTICKRFAEVLLFLFTFVRLTPHITSLVFV